MIYGYVLLTNIIYRIRWCRRCRTKINIDWWLAPTVIVRIWKWYLKKTKINIES